MHKKCCVNVHRRRQKSTNPRKETKKLRLKCAIGVEVGVICCSGVSKTVE